MGKNQSASNLTNIIKQDANGGIAFMSGSTMLMSLSTTGQMSGSSPAMSAVTASYADNFTVKGTLTAQTIVSQVVTSSTSLITGSTIFGTSLANTHIFTGSVSITGSLAVVTTGTEFQVTNTGVRIGNVIGDTHNITGSVGISGSATFASTIASSGDITITKSSDASFIANNTSASGKSYRLVSKDDGKFYIQNTGVADLITITSSGNLGIGTSSPSELLHINSSAASAEIRLQTSAMSSYIRSESDNLNFYINNGERMRIGSNGRVGIGTSSPNGTLEVYAATPTIISGASTSDSLHGYEFRQSNTLDAYIKQLPSTGELRFYVGRNSSWGGNMSFWTDTVNRMSLSSSGTLSINSPRFIQQGLSRLCYAGTIGGNQSITITLNVGSQSAVKITAAMNHYGYIDGYGCARMSWVGANPAFSEINISNVTSGNGGSWSFTHGGGGIITITKNAGSYGGGGYFFVEVIGNDPISIA